MTKPAPVYVLGGAQTDFARNWTKEGKHFVAMMREATWARSKPPKIEPREVETAHVGNFAAELYAKQGHLGAFFVEIDPAFSGLPTSRHEAACASGSIAILAASAEIEAGRYDLACVVGVEQMKTVDSTTGGDFLGTAAWYEREAKGIEFPFPKLFGRLGDEYDKRYGLKDEHLAHISAVNYSNAKRNPMAQTRNWFMSESHAQHESKFNQVIGGRIKVSDCSQVTDGSVAIFLASEKFATAWAKRNGTQLADIPRILGWGHHTAPLEFDTKVAESRDNAVRAAAYAPGDCRRVQARGHRLGDGALGNRDARLLHDVGVHGDRSLRHHQAGRVVEGGRGRRDRARRQAADQSERRADRRGPSGRRDRRAPDARLPSAGDAYGGRLPGRGREEIRDAEHRRQRHHQLRVRRRQVARGPSLTNATGALPVCHPDKASNAAFPSS